MKAHLPEYFAEFLGTAIMMTIGIGAVTLMFAEGGVMRNLIPSDDVRRLITGMLFAGGGTLVVLSPLGQRSGGHLNPAVTLAFWWKGRITTPDAIWYVVAQIVGAVLGVFIVATIGGEAARSIHLGLTAPGTGYSALTAFIAELVITFLLVFLLVFCVSNNRFASKTPYIVGVFIAFLVFVEAPISGTSLNPARSLAPALMTLTTDAQWIYIAAPLIGALLAVNLYGLLFPNAQKSGCAKLFHTERYRCIFMDCVHTHFPAGTVLMRQGEVADTAYIVERGEVEVRLVKANGEEVVAARLGPGEWVGEMALLLNLPRSATVVATKDCELRTLTRDNFAHVIAEHPIETQRLLSQLGARLNEANRQLSGVPLAAGD